MEDLQKTLEQYKNQFLHDLAHVQSEQDLENFRIKYLGRQGILSTLMSMLKPLSLEDKKILGPIFNDFKEQAQEAFNTKKAFFDNQKHLLEAEKLAHFDVTAYKPD